MPVQCGIFTPIPMSIFWNPYNVGLPVGLPIVGGIHYHIAGVNLLMTVFKSYTGLPSSSATSISPFAMYMIVCTTEALYLFIIIFSYLKPQLDLILYRSDQLYLLSIHIASFFVNSPFLWNTIPHSILQIKKSNLFRAALRQFLFK